MFRCGANSLCVLSGLFDTTAIICDIRPYKTLWGMRFRKRQEPTALREFLPMPTDNNDRLRARLAELETTNEGLRRDSGSDS